MTRNFSPLQKGGMSEATQFFLCSTYDPTCDILHSLGD